MTSRGEKQTDRDSNDLQRLFGALARAAEQRLSSLTAQHVANMAWTFAMMNYLVQKLVAAFARAAEERLSEFNAQGVARCSQHGRGICTGKHHLG